MSSRRNPLPHPGLTSQTLLASGPLSTSSSCFSRTHSLGVGIPLKWVFGPQVPYLAPSPGASSSPFLRHHWPWPCINSIRAVTELEPHLQGPPTFKSHLSFLSAHPPIPGPAAQLYRSSSRRPALRSDSLCSPVPPPLSGYLGHHTNRKRTIGECSQSDTSPQPAPCEEMVTEPPGVTSELSLSITDVESDSTGVHAVRSCPGSPPGTKNSLPSC